MKRIRAIASVLFILSLLWYVFWAGYGIYCAFTGVDSGWAMPAMSSGELDYGIDGFVYGIIVGVLFTVKYCLFIPLYQIIYITVNAVMKIKARRASREEQK